MMNNEIISGIIGLILAAALFVYRNGKWPSWPSPKPAPAPSLEELLKLLLDEIQKHRDTGQRIDAIREKLGGK